MDLNADTPIEPAFGGVEWLNTRACHVFADKINSAWRRGTETLIECGRLLREANDELPRAVFKAMVKTKLDFEASVARKLMCVAANQTLCAHAHILPPCWTTLYELSQLTEATLKAALADGRIHPKMMRRDAAALRSPRKTTARPATANAAKITPFARYATDKLHSALACAEQPNDENIKRMVALLGCIIKNADAKGIARSDIVVAEGKPKGRK